MLVARLLGLLPLAAGAELWSPPLGSSWQIVLKKDTGLVDFDSSGAPSPNIDIYDLDLIDTPTDLIRTLQLKGKKVICYFSAGSQEDWRSDSSEFSKEDRGKPLKGWPGETWVRISSPDVRDIMKKRIQLASEKGCDAIDPDNLDGYDNDNGLGLTEADSVSYIKFLAEEARRYNMSTGLKNAMSLLPQVSSSVQFAVNEQCVRFQECGRYTAFVAAGKPVFHIEYPDKAPDLSTSDVEAVCSQTQNLSTVIKTYDLVSWVQYCDGTTFGKVTEKSKGGGRPRRIVESFIPLVLVSVIAGIQFSL